MFEFRKASIDALEKLIPLVCINFVETKDGLVFIKEEQNKKESQIRNSVMERNALPNTDKTAIESLANHIHINEKLGIKSQVQNVGVNSLSAGSSFMLPHAGVLLDGHMGTVLLC